MKYVSQPLEDGESVGAVRLILIESSLIVCQAMIIAMIVLPAPVAAYLMYHVPFGEEGYPVKTDAENAAMKPDITVNELRELGAVTLDGVYWVSKEGSRGRYTAYSGAFVAVD